MNLFEQRFNQFYASIVDHPGKYLLAWLAIITLMIGALLVDTKMFTQVAFNDGPYLFFDEDNPAYKDLREMESHYQADRTLILLVTMKQGDLFNQQALAAVENITSDAWTLPHVSRVNSISNFQHTKVIGDDLITDDLYEDALQLTDEKIQQIKNLALNEKTLLQQTLGSSGQSTAIIANVIADDALSQMPEIMAATYKLLDKYKQKYPFADIRVLGDVPFAEAAQMATMQALTETSPISMTLVLLCLLILLRSVFCVIITQVMIGLSIMLAYVVFLLSGHEMSPPSALASPMILTLAVADCVHILVSYLQQCSMGKSRRDAMYESLRINFQPVWLTSITTGIGFLLMNYAESPPFRDLGNAVFFGVMFAFALSVTFLPAVMMFLPKPRYRFGQSQQRYMTSLGEFTIRHSKKLLVSMTAVVICTVMFVPMNRVNDIFNEYFDDSYAVCQSLDFYLHDVGGLQRLQFSVPARNEGGVMEPEYLHNLDKLVRWAETQPQVSNVRSFTEVVKRLNRNIHNGDASAYSIPNDRELISQYVLLYEMGLPFGLGLDSQITLDKSASKLEIVFDRVTSEQLINHRSTINAWIKDNWPDYMQTQATGLDSLFGDISFDNVESMLTGTVIALLLVSALLIYTLRSLRYGLLSLLPNLLPAAMAFGIWGLINGEVGLVASVLGCMTLGIIVDDTVHFLSKYVRAKREMGLNAEQASLYAFKTVGVSLIATTVILVANFSVMGFSHYAPNVAMGVLTSMIIAIALLLDFLFFVPLLLMMDKSKPEFVNNLTIPETA